LPVFIDSPMAVQVTAIYCRHAEQHDGVLRFVVERSRCPFCSGRYTLVRSVAESKGLNARTGRMIIVSASGMATGGRILHHLLLRLPDPRNQVIFIGFQAPGTRGATIKSGAKSVRIFSQPVPIRAQVAALEQFSDHADTEELLRWLSTFRGRPQATFLVHGEADAASRLQAAISSGLGWSVEIARWLEKVKLG